MDFGSLNAPHGNGLEIGGFRQLWYRWPTSEEPMTLYSRNEDVFLLCEGVTISGPAMLEEVRDEGGHPVACALTYRPGGESRASVSLRWNRVSQKRLDAGDIVDMLLIVTRRGASIGDDILDVEFSAETESIYDPAFAAVAAASFLCKTPDRLAGAEMIILNENGAQHSLPIGGREVGHGATGHQFLSRPAKASLAIRFHLKATAIGEDQFVVRLGRLFFGLQYDAYAFNPYYELSLNQGRVSRAPNFADVAADFIRSAREMAKTLRFRASQSFVLPFEAAREGRTNIFMLCGTVNSLYWYGMTPRHHMEEYEDMGFIEPGDTVLDCGAHAGQMSAFFGRAVGASGRVLAFEPFPQNYLQVEAQGRLNGLDGLVSTRAGVGERREVLNVPNAVQMILPGGYDHGLADQLEIDIHRIDDYLDARPTAIKLDVEGAEVAALRGAQRVLRDCRPKLFCEFHTQLVGQFGHSVQDYFDAIPHDLYHTTYVEEGKDGVWRTYTPGADRQEWSMPGIIKSFPK